MIGAVSALTDVGRRRWLTAPPLSVCAALAIWLGTPTAHASPNPPPFPCQYPGVGWGVPNVMGGWGGFCDFPTEINGSHWHCHSLGWDLGDLVGGTNIGSGGFILGFGEGIGGSGMMCGFRWPDNTDAPAPNPPGAWKDFMVPRPPPPEHATPSGPTSELVRPDQGSFPPYVPPTSPALTNPGGQGNPAATQNQPQQ